MSTRLFVPTRFYSELCFIPFILCDNKSFDCELCDHEQCSSGSSLALAFFHTNISLLHLPFDGQDISRCFDC